ncbi:MAG: hypothetical protein NTZ43_02625 [Gemmatimonadetes bacterium]|nr:hypothetical protein [Gemmatimonadota bacterium]
MKTKKWVVAAVLSAGVVSACKTAPPAPSEDTRKMGYDLLSETGHVGAGVVLLSLVDDSVYLKLDSVEVSGLDRAIKTWSEVGKGARITSIRHKIVGSTLEKAMLTDTGIVQFTLLNKDEKTQRDTVLAFKAIWNLKKVGWRLGLEQMMALPVPPAAKKP